MLESFDLSLFSEFTVTVSQRQSIRDTIRRQRQALTSAQQQQAAQKAAQQALNYPLLQQAKNIALFLSFDGELDTRPLIENLWQRGQQVCLPVLHPFSSGQLLFLRYTPDTPLLPNRFRIPEPVLDVRELVPLAALDVILVPLVAFDLQGQRLGMGGGFYDRTLQHHQDYRFQPVGLAHNCQQVDALPVESWDIPLPAVITPDKIWQWS